MADSTPGGPGDRPAPPDRGPRRRPARTALAAVLILLAALLTPLGILASWAHTEIADTDRYVATVAPLADDPAVRSAVADRVTAAIVEKIPVDSLLNGVVPGDTPLLGDLLQHLGPALTGGVTDLVRTGVQDFVRSDAFRQVWIDLNRDAHAALDRELTGQGGGAVRVEGDAVLLDLAPVVARVKTALVADGFAAASRIPEIHTSYTLVRSPQVERVRTGLRLLALAGLWVAVLAVLCGAAGVLAAVHRRRALVAAALATGAGALALGLALTSFRAVYLDRLPAGVDQAAAAAVYDTLVRYLRQAVRTVLALGVLVALGGWLTGPGRWAAGVRGFWQEVLGAVRTYAARLGLRLGPVGRFVHRSKAWLCRGAVAGAVLALLLWDRPTATVVVLLGAALLAVLAVVELLDDRPTAPPPWDGVT